ncbi:MAG: methyltransferase domain-containing protein [Cyclobacteriaceae bacterium]|jgi:SAM-dependent methyltransferase|nr:methyltransferase domain-containing protein [Cyclobacteriaceae bacterium]
MKWEEDIYALGKQVNRWPYTDVISAVKRIFPGNALEGKTVAELGCGTGNNLIFFAEEKCHASGIDFSTSAVDLGNNYLKLRGLNAEIFPGDVTKSLPWSDKSCDIVLDRGCITQVPFTKLNSLFEEVYRVLKPGGYFFSFTLFGNDSSDLSFGSMVEKNTFDKFSTGYFSKIGLTSVYDFSVIKQLWANFELVQVTKLSNENLLSSNVLTTFAVISKKPF